MICQLIPHMDMHDYLLPPNPGHKEYGQLYNQANPIRHRMEMYNVIAPDDTQGYKIRFQRIPHLPDVVALNLSSEPVTIKLFPRGQRLQGPDDCRHSSPALPRGAYHHYFHSE